MNRKNRRPKAKANVSFDPSLRESVLRMSARPEVGLWGSLLAGLRGITGMTPEAQAQQLGIDLDGLCRLSLCRLPRADQRLEDIETVARYAGVDAAILETLLSQPGAGGRSEYP